MGYSAELGMGSIEQKTSKGLKEKAASLRVNRIKKPLQYCKVENPVYVDQHHERRQSAGDEPEVHHPHSLTNHNRQWLKSMGDKNDELVKHMRNLPGYLQCVGKGENLQGKALNFGVLDWGRLENWKSNEKRIPPRYNKNTSPYCNNPTLVESESARLSRTMNKILPRKDQQASNGCHLSSPSRGRLSPGLRWPRGKAVKVQNSEISPGQMLDGVQTPCWKALSSGRNYDEVEPNSSKGKQADQLTSSGRESSPSDWRKHGSWYSSHDATRAQASATKMQSEENINHADDPCPSRHHNVPLYSSGDFPRSSSSDDLWLSESKKSCDDNLTEANETRLSNCSEEFHSINPFFEVPHSCPFPLRAGIKPEPECPYETPVTPLKVRSLEENKSVGEHLTSGEQPPVKGTYSSPNRRFSFSLGKMGRSLSFKETSAVPQLTSTYTSVKSGPVNFEASPDLDSYNLKKGSATTTRSRSSPLRRLLDPLLKHKGAHVALKFQQSNRGLDSTSVNSINADEVLNGKKHRSSNVQALLQLTKKNGVPFFKLVVDSSSDILAAAVKKLPTSGKDDSCLIYAFYSVHEIKKKSWINHGSKGKSCGFGYNIVGQMKISSSYHAEFSGPEKDLYVVRESVLYSTDIVRADQKTPDCMPGRELAAIIVKNPSDENCGDIGSSKSMLVILPGGIHTVPNCGLPSPLINRWRCGGTCDCGGWDIGCQFHILTNQNEMVKAPSPNHLHLRYQGGCENKHTLSLVPLQNGLYSLEYDDASISLLQAFSICVAVVSSQKLSHIFQVDYIAEAKDLSTPIATSDEEVKSQAAVTVGSEIPARYMSKPPASPVGRV